MNLDRLQELSKQKRPRDAGVFVWDLGSKIYDPRIAQSNMDIRSD